MISGLPAEEFGMPAKKSVLPAKKSGETAGAFFRYLYHSLNELTDKND